MGFLMQRYNYTEPRLFLVLLCILLAFVILFYCITSMIISVGYHAFAEKETPFKRITVILDAGHGGEDPGAIANGLVEKELNLKITKKIAEFLKLSGYHVVLTRNEDRMLYNSGEVDRKKFYDLANRVKITESYDQSVMISIHMNKFHLEECKGLQTFYTDKNTSNELFAKIIQENALMFDKDNHRQPKNSEEQIYLLKNVSVPSVLIECGFLSNTEDAEHLSDESFQNMLAFAIYCGICEFLEEY